MPTAQKTPRSAHVFVRPATSRAADRSVAAGLGAPSSPTVGWMIDQFLAAVADGSARDRFGRPFTPDASRAMHWHLRAHLGRARGGWRLRRLDRPDIEALLLELHACGLSPERLSLLARSVRALFDHALERRLVDHNPAERLAIPDGHDADQPAARPSGRPRSRLRALVGLTALAGLLTAGILLGVVL